MRLTSIFNEFLSNTVNLNDTRVSDLEKSIEAIKSAVRSSDWEPHISGWMAHGSWAHKTIIKPVDQGEFDADLLVFVEHVSGWDAATYVEKLYWAFKSNATYKDMVARSSHCVTVSYANDKQIDIAPCVTNRLYPINQLEVCNRNKNQFERTEPKQYTAWLVEQNGYSGSNSFRKVTRLVKYLRDRKTSFTCPSVLLTTLLGMAISPTDKGSAEFSDTPTALRTIFGRLDNWLQRNTVKPSVNNPFLWSENFADLWTDDQYSNFRDKVHTYREWIDDAFDEEDRSESISKWRRVFGSDFARGEVLEEGRTVAKSAVALMKSTALSSVNFSGDLVDAVRAYGFGFLPRNFYRLSYMDKPKWKQADTLIPVIVRADLYDKENGRHIKRVDGPEPLPSGFWLHFRASTTTGSPFGPNDYKIRWRVTNTDEQAFQADALRGGFYKAESDNSRWEQLAYRGVHIVEAFVIRKRGNLLIAKSEPFKVVIG